MTSVSLMLGALAVCLLARPCSALPVGCASDEPAFKSLDCANWTNVSVYVWVGGEFVGGVPGQASAELRLSERLSDVLSDDPSAVPVVAASRLPSGAVVVNGLTVLWQEDAKTAVGWGGPPEGNAALVKKEAEGDFGPGELAEAAAAFGERLDNEQAAPISLGRAHAAVNRDARPPAMAIRHGGRLRVANSVGVLLVEVPAGTFVSGVQQQITLSRPFLIATTEVTAAQYAMAPGSPPADPDTAELPAGGVNWVQAEAYCQWLSAQDGLKYQLPTEAQWEMACQAGQRAPFNPPDAAPERVAWHARNSGRRPHPVARLLPNGLGLYDMHGNVREWCRDWWDPRRPPSGDDPAGPRSGSERVRRGGAFDIPLQWCSCGARDGCPPDIGHEDVGFRIVVDFTASDND